MKEESFTGGFRIGKGFFALNGTWPFAKLTIGPDLVILSCLGFRYEFSKKNLTRISRYSGFISSGLRFHHTDPGYSDFLVFWYSDDEKIAAALKEQGFEIES